ncbi:MAG: hypothetical protein H6736_21775 [Alphaproteobacteria bacterium]|nr:hypothetical protein [Alphaproteobacteria bacterium]
MYGETGVRSVHVNGTASAGHADATWAVTNGDAGRLVDLVGPTVNGNTAMAATHTYDDRGRLAGIFANGPGQFNMLYDAASRMSELQRPNGANTTYAYDDSNRSTAISTNDAVSTVVHEVLTTYDDRRPS